MRTALATLAQGFCMGAADVVPGVSGGTMAFILGIYHRLIRALRAFDVELLRLLWRRELHAAVRHVDLAFLVTLGSGILAAVVFFTRVVPIPQLLVTHPELVYGLFFGLIAASVLVLLGSLPKLGTRDLLWMGAGAVIGFAIVNLVPVSTPETAWFVFLSGMLAITAMLLPGISGSFILLILRKYAYVIDAIGRIDLTIIAPFALGAGVGILIFSRALGWLLRHLYRQTIATITGVLVGSLWVIWPFQERIYEMVRDKPRLVSSTPVLPSALDADVVSAGGLCLIGIAAVLTVQRLAGVRVTGGDA